jgi:hypothetical protein
VADAAEHLATVEARAVVPLRVPRSLPYALGLLAVAVALLSWPLDARRAQASLTEPLPGIVAVADQVRQDLLQLDELAKEEQNQELKDLVSKLKEMAEEMKEPGVDEREALAKLSEMQTEIAALQAQFNVGLVDGQLASLGAAMSASPALEGAGQALQEAKHDKAAEKLEELEDPEMTRKEAKAVEEKMKQVADAMGEAGLGQLSDAVSEMAEGLSDGKGGKFKKGTKKLAKEVRNQARRRRINRTLLAQLARLSDAKCDCQSNNLAKGKLPLKSLSPSNSFGMSTSGNVIGEKTELLAQRNQQDITGDPGEGPSEVETTHSPEGRQQAGRSYQQIYREYQKRSEAVLDSEPIPLGHRQTIRKYFELIRPQNLEAEPPTAEPATR